MQAITTNYNRAPFFNRYMEMIRPVFLSDPEKLSVLNINLAEKMRLALGIETRTVVVSELPAMREDPTDRFIDICRHFGADTYLAGQGGANYMDLARFEKSRIKVVLQNFEHPVYPQLFGDFVSHLSVIDMLFNCGPDGAAMIGKGA